MKNIFKATLITTLALILLMPCIFGVSAAVPNVIKESIPKTFESQINAGYSLGYRIYVPADYDASKTYPVLLFLHGAGERGSDNASHMNSTVQNLFNTRPDTLAQTIVVAPQCPAGQQWVDYPWAKANYSSDKIKESKALSTAFEILTSVMNEYSCDRDRVYALGLSMGGYGTWDMLVRHGDTFAAAVPLCGGGDASKADYLKNIPIWTYHGTADPTVQFKGTQEMYNSIVAAGGEKIKFNAVEGAGHNVWDAATTNGELIDWLFANKLSDRMPKEEVTTEPEADPEIPTTQAPDNTDKKDGGCSGSASVLAVPAAVMLGAAVVLKKKKEDRA